MHSRLVVVLLLCATAAAAQGRRGGNPAAGDREAMARGEKTYAARCAGCHGRDGKGGEAPSLHKSRIVVLSPDPRFFQVVKEGVPGVGMPPLAGPDSTIWEVVAYVHSIAKPGMGPPVPGDPQAGRAVFQEAGCVRCHIVEGRGGVLGPNLASIALQSSSAAIRESIADPAARVAPGYRAVTVRFADGRTMDGVLKNEDNFSIQLMTSEGELRAFPRTGLEMKDRQPFMPRGWGSRLAPEQLQNLLAFLDRQRAPSARAEIGFQNY